MLLLMGLCLALIDILRTCCLRHLLRLALLLLQDLKLRLIGLRVALVHQYSAVLLVPQSHDASFVVYHIEEFVNNFLIFDLNILSRCPISSLLTMDRQTIFAFATSSSVCLLSLLCLDTVDLVHQGLLHLWWHWHMDMHNVAVFRPWLVIPKYLVIVHQRSSVWILNFLSFMDGLNQLVSYLILELCIGHHRQVVESAR